LVQDLVFFLNTLLQTATERGFKLVCHYTCPSLSRRVKLCSKPSGISRFLVFTHDVDVVERAESIIVRLQLGHFLMITFVSRFNGRKHASVVFCQWFGRQETVWLMGWHFQTV
jgi:hypothetical protein